MGIFIEDEEYYTPLCYLKVVNEKDQFILEEEMCTSWYVLGALYKQAYGARSDLVMLVKHKNKITRVSICP